MDFRSMNKFNVIMNFASGNLLPLSGEDTDLGLPSAAYFIFVWLIEITYVLMTMIGLLCYVPILEALRAGGVVVIVYIEVFSLSAYLNSQRKNLRDLVRIIDRILEKSNELGRRIILKTIEPPKERLKVYTVVNLISSIIWEGQAIVKVLKTDRFTYTDFTVTSYFPGDPFTVNVFVLAVIVRTLGGTYLMLKKIGIDIYMSYGITLLTAEYRYIREQMIFALREKNEILVIDALKECVQRHCIAVEIGKILTEILSVNVGLTYLNSVLRFCFLAFSLITLPSYFEKCLYVTFTTGSLIQVYMLCWCIQELLEASTSIADEAFHENWYGRGRNVRSIFQTIVMGNRLECRLTAFRIIDLTVPTFATILKQAYSACLLLLNIK